MAKSLVRVKPQNMSKVQRAIAKYSVFVALHTHIQDLAKQWRSIVRSRTAAYDPKKNGLPPIRNSKQEALPVKEIRKVSQSMAGKLYLSTSVSPFLFSTSAEEREKLYGRLACVKFEKKHMKNPSEAIMIELGEYTVVSAEDIKKGQCIGVYGGCYAEPRAMHLIDPTYLLKVNVPEGMRGDPRAKGGRAVDGDNILSRINTIFEEENGVPKRQAKGGYNIDWTEFRVKLKDDSWANVVAFHALEDLPKGTELRFNYGYDEDRVSRGVVNKRD